MFRESEDYEHFADFIRTKSRYVLDGWQQDFVNTIVETSKKRTTTLPANQILWRAAPGSRIRTVYIRTKCSFSTTLNRTRSSA